MCLFLDEASYWAETLLRDINLHPLMSEDNNFGGSLVLNPRIKVHPFENMDGWMEPFI